jgi:transcription elongation factor Elf1
VTSADDKNDNIANSAQEKRPKEKPVKQVVYSLSRASRCYRCDKKLAVGELVKLEKSEEDKEALCQKCSGLDGMHLIARGNAKITRLASKYSTQIYIVMKWSEVWKTYERLGILAEPEAVEKAQAESGETLKKAT